MKFVQVVRNCRKIIADSAEIMLLMRHASNEQKAKAVTTMKSYEFDGKETVEETMARWENAYSATKAVLAAKD